VTVKIFISIFALYILFLSTIPCCALDNCQDETSITQKSNQHEHSDGCKNCSPFNQCDNCIGFAFSSKIIQIDTPQQFSQQIFSGCTQFYLPEYVSSFWQPPKLS
jgi:hypothetical protein